MTEIIKHLAAVTCNPGQVPNGPSCISLPNVSPDTQVHTILQIVFGVIAAVALIFMVLAGLKFVTSAGNPDQVAKARQAIIYGAIGLIIAASAEIIVTFVLGRI